MSTEQTAGDVLERGMNALRQAEKSGLARELRKFLAYILGVDVSRLEYSLDTPIPAETVPVIEDAFHALIGGMPLSRLIKKRAFWKEEFYITPAVLDPRPDTETLVEAALDSPFSTVLDLGTGSGCILVSLLNERRNAAGVGTDISQDALDVAARNVKDAGCSDVATLIQSDWFSNVEGRFDVIVSNPPYIDAERYVELDASVRNYDPKGALTPGPSGLEAHEVIVPGARDYLVSGGWLMVEIGYDQADAVKALFITSGYDAVEVLKDINSKDRVVRGKAP